MALKPTIYKFNIALSDLDKNYYDNLQLTVAQHPSETPERMMARVLAYCINANQDLTFTKGLSESEEPDIWQHSNDNQLKLWIDVGEPEFERIKKASRLASQVMIYSFNSKSNTWWQQSSNNFSTIKVEVFQLPWEKIQQLAGLVERTTTCAITITENTVYISTDSGDCECPWLELKTN